MNLFPDQEDLFPIGSYTEDNVFVSCNNRHWNVGHAELYAFCLHYYHHHRHHLLLDWKEYQMLQLNIVQSFVLVSCARPNDGRAEEAEVPNARGSRVRQPQERSREWC